MLISTALNFHPIFSSPTLSYYSLRLSTTPYIVCSKEVQGRELRAFDDTKLGVKGLFDAGGMEKIPRIFVYKKEHQEKCGNKKFQSRIPFIHIHGGVL